MVTVPWANSSTLSTALMNRWKRIPPHDSIIARLLECPSGTLNESSATDDFASDKSFYVRMVGVPCTSHDSLDSTDSDSRVDEMWDTSDIPLLESVIARMMGCCPIGDPSTIEDIIYYRSIVARMVEHPSTLDTSPDTLFTPHDPVDSTDSDKWVDEMWDTSDIPLLESVIARMMGSCPMDDPSTIEDITYFRSITASMVERRSTVDTSPDTLNTTDPKPIPGGTTDCCTVAQTSSHSIDCDYNFYELWGINDIPHLVSITVRMIESQRALKESITTGDIGYFESIIIRLMERQATAGEECGRSDHTADDDSVIDDIMGSEWPLDDADDPHIFGSRSNPNESCDPTNHNDVVLAVEFLSILDRSQDVIKSPDEYSYVDLIRSYNCIGGIAQLQWDITRMEEMIPALRIPELTRMVTMHLTWVVYQRYKRFGDSHDLERVIQGIKKLLQNPDYLGEFRPDVIRWLVFIYHNRFKRLGNIEDLDRAIRLCEDEIATTAHNVPGRTDLLSYLGCCYKLRFDWSGSTKDIDKAILIFKEGIIAQSHNTARYVTMANLGTLYNTRFACLWNIEDLERAILLCDEVVAATSHDNPDRSYFLGTLGCSYQLRFKQTGNTNDGERAILFGEKAVKDSPRQRPQRAINTINLSASYYERFYRLGHFRDLDRAIQLGEEAVAATPRTAPHYSIMVHNLAMLDSSRFERFGAVDDLERSIPLSEAAVAATPKNCRHRLGVLVGLNNCLAAKIGRFNSLEYLNEGTQALEESLPTTLRDATNRACVLNCMGMCYINRAHLDTGIQTLQEALAAIAGGHPRRPTVLANLGSSLGMRSLLSMKPEDNDKELKVSEEAVAATPLDHPDRAARLKILSSQLVYIPIEIQTLIVQAVLLICKKAVSYTVSILIKELKSNTEPLEQLEQLGHLIEDLSILEVLQVRFDSTVNGQSSGVDENELLDIEEQLDGRCRQSEFLAEVKKNAEQKLNKLLADVPESPWHGFLAQKAKLYNAGTVSNRDRSRNILLAAWHCQSSPPQDRIQAAQKASVFLASSHRWKDASELLHNAVQVLPQLTPQFLARDDQEYMLSGFTQLASDAAAMALQAGETPSHCLGILELGRGIIMGLAINCRSDVSELQIKYPDICDRFNRLRIEIDKPIVGKDVENHIHEARRRRRVQAMEELHEIVIGNSIAPFLTGRLKDTEQ